MFWLINLVFGILHFLLGVLLFVVLAFIVAKLAIPENKYVLLADKYMEMVLAPLRKWLKKTFPQVAELKLDISPFVLWVLILVVRILVRLLWNILL